MPSGLAARWGRTARILNQEEINARLIADARAGKTVVRLKGGDPFIFGRGSEEAAALAEAGIPFEVVPGVTAAVAAGEYAGISLTHRQQSSAVAFVTGHEDPQKPGSRVDYHNLAGFAGTLVFYMGLHRLPKIVASLISAGKDPHTPACVISRATTPLQRTVTASLAESSRGGRRRGIACPVANHRGGVRHSAGKNFLVRASPAVRPHDCDYPAGIHQADDAISQALELGAQPVLLPTIEILPPEDWSPIDEVLSRLTDYDWLIFTSANGVESLSHRLWSLGRDARALGHLKLAAIGPATAETLHRYQLRADVVPESYRAEALAESSQTLGGGTAGVMGRSESRAGRVAHGTRRRRC